MKNILAIVAIAAIGLSSVANAQDKMGGKMKDAKPAMKGKMAGHDKMGKMSGGKMGHGKMAGGKMGHGKMGGGKMSGKMGKDAKKSGKM